MKRLVLTIACTAFIFNAQAQESLDVNHKLAYTWGGKFHIIDENGYRVERNLKKPRMMEIMSQTPHGKEMYLDYYRKYQTSKILGYAGLAPTVGGATMMILSLVSSFDDVNIPLFWSGLAVTGVGLGMEIAAIPFGISAKTKAYQTTSYFNKSSGKISFNVGLTRNGAGLIVKF
ncbi:hypothetical protein [Edaphocola flava]|uniref:hypothetical protein n=1 Tax=Edaphocola flava TaxID=2499629 RepID=UPI00100BF309|nr:hypothetical protein [Edaphocola flava]